MSKSNSFYSALSGQIYVQHTLKKIYTMQICDNFNEMRAWHM